MSQTHGKPHEDAFCFQVGTKTSQRKRRKERCRDGNELRKKKVENNEGIKAQEDVVMNLNKVSCQPASSKGDHDTDRSEVTWKTLKKAKKTHLKDDVLQAGSNPEKQYKRVRLDPLVSSKHGENKKNRKHHWKKKVRKKRCHNDERKDGNELRKRKTDNTEDTKTWDDVAVTLKKLNNQFESVKGSLGTDGSAVKTLKKAKKRHCEDDLDQAASVDTEKLHKRLRVNTLVISKNEECKEKRKHKAFSCVPEHVQTKTKHKAKQKRNSKDKVNHMHEKESNNMHAYLEPRALDRSRSGCSFMGNDLGSRSENERESKEKKKKKKKKYKEKERSKTVHSLTEDVKLIAKTRKKHCQLMFTKKK